MNTTQHPRAQPRTRRAVDVYRHDHPHYIGWVVWATITAACIVIWLVAIIAAIGLFT